MPSQILTDLLDATTAEHTVVASAIAFINGVPGLIADAVTKALANGATAEELAPFQAVIDAIKADSAATQAALLANTPGGPVVAAKK